jgi:hypothetical protein
VNKNKTGDAATPPENNNKNYITYHLKKTNLWRKLDLSVWEKEKETVC